MTTLLVSQVGGGPAALCQDPRHWHNSREEAQLCGDLPAGWWVVLCSGRQLQGRLHQHLPLEQQWLLYPPVPSPLASGHTCGVPCCWREASPHPLQRLSDAGGLPVEPKPEAVYFLLPNHRASRCTDGEALLGEESSLPLPHTLHRWLQDPPLGRAAFHRDPDSSLSRLDGSVSFHSGPPPVPHSWKWFLLLHRISVGWPHSTLSALPGAQHESAASVQLSICRQQGHNAGR